MRTTTLLAIALTLGALHPSGALAHRFGHPTVPANELQFGMGWVDLQEKSVFNIEFDSSLEPAIAYQFVFYLNTTDQAAFGIHLYWSHQDIDPLVLNAPRNPLVPFHADSYNLGPRARYTFWRGFLSPYVYGGMSYAFGYVTGEERDFGRIRFNYDGFTLTGAFGISLLSTGALDVGVEAFYLGGWASWNDYPFLNSTSRDFDPSMFGVLGNVTLRF